MDEPLIVDLKFLGIVFVVSSVVLHWLFVYAWVTEQWLLSTYQIVPQVAHEVFRRQNEVSALKDKASEKDWVLLLRVLNGPLLAFAIALRIAKITGEIRIERRKAEAAAQA
jgi:hypothetical protein